MTGYSEFISAIEHKKDASERIHSHIQSSMLSEAVYTCLNVLVTKKGWQDDRGEFIWQELTL